MTADPIAETIARMQAASRPQPVEQRMRAGIALASGRHVGIDLPSDMTDGEFVELVGTLTVQVRNQVAAARSHRPVSRLLVPR